MSRLNRFKILIFFTFLPSLSFADIFGTWKVDRDSTLKFNEKYFEIENSKKALLKCFSENLYLTVGKSNFSVVLKDHSCALNGKDSKINGFSTSYDYTNFLETDEMVVLISDHDNSAPHGEILYKTESNTVWTYFPGEPPLYDSHMRIYYKRIGAE